MYMALKKANTKKSWILLLYKYSYKTDNSDVNTKTFNTKTYIEVSFKIIIQMVQFPNVKNTVL
jgi:hypothetical protein